VETTSSGNTTLNIPTLVPTGVGLFY